MRRFATLSLVVAVVLAGCAAPTAPTGTPGPAAEGGTAVDPTATAGAPDSGTATPASESTDGRPDPETDVQGWENGYWYDERLPVTPGDGYNDSELSALVARAMARVERIRDVEFDRDVDVRIVARSALSGGVGGGGGGGPTVQQVESRALLLVGDRADAGEQANETDRATVQGYYSPRRDEIVVVSPTETPRVDESTLGHELVHAYQFRHRSFGLPRSPSTDAVEAFRAVVEGEANVVQRRYERRCGANWSCARPDRGGGGGAAAGGNASVHMGLYLRSYFPYAEGEAFVRRAYERGGWDAVTDLFADPPRSTEEVIHPDRSDPPETVRVGDRSSGDWRRLEDAAGRPSVTVGENGLATMFMYTAYDDRPGGVVAREQFLNVENGSVDRADPLDYGLNYTTGWAGDSLAAYADGGETAYVWRIRWDDAAEAREFLRGYRRLLAYRGGERVGTDGAATYWRLDGEFAGGYYVAVDGRTVTVVHAPSVEALGEVWEPAGRGG